MTHKTAANHALRGAKLISRLLKDGRIPESDRADAADLAIDLAELAKHHCDLLPAPAKHDDLEALISP